MLTFKLQQYSFYVVLIAIRKTFYTRQIMLVSQKYKFVVQYSSLGKASGMLQPPLKSSSKYGGMVNSKTLNSRATSNPVISDEKKGKKSDLRESLSLV